MRDQFFYLAGCIVAIGFCGAAFTLGVALVCKAMNWSPVNITVNVNQTDGFDR